jgi:hypothetical protein
MWRIILKLRSNTPKNLFLCICKTSRNKKTTSKWSLGYCYLSIRRTIRNRLQSGV